MLRRVRNCRRYNYYYSVSGFSFDQCTLFFVGLRLSSFGAALGCRWVLGRGRQSLVVAAVSFSPYKFSLVGRKLFNLSVCDPLGTFPCIVLAPSVGKRPQRDRKFYRYQQSVISAGIRGAGLAMAVCLQSPGPCSSLLLAPVLHYSPKVTRPLPVYTGSSFIFILGTVPRDLAVGWQCEGPGSAPIPEPVNIPYLPQYSELEGAIYVTQQSIMSRLPGHADSSLKIISIRAFCFKDTELHLYDRCVLDTDLWTTWPTSCNSRALR